MIRLHWSHPACPLLHEFDRSWVAPQITRDGWNESGVVYRHEDGRVLYATVRRASHVVVGEEGAREEGESWSVYRQTQVEERMERVGCDRHETLDEAVHALADEVTRSRRAFGPVPEEEWPENVGRRWYLTSFSRAAPDAPAPHGPTSMP